MSIGIPGIPPPAAPARRSLWKHVFLGPRGLRAGWRLLVFIAINMLVAAGVRLVLPASLKQQRAWTAPFFLLDEALGFAVAWVAAAVMARLEKRSFADYGLPLRGAFGGRFWAGTLWGLVAVVALLGTMSLLGGFDFGRLALAGPRLVTLTLLWALAFLFVGLYEELLFRGYALSTLASGMGFWPGAVLLSLVFGAVHYFLKPMETWADGLSVTLIGFFLCLTLRRTGSLWWAIGFHFGFDWAALFVFGGPNSGNGGRPMDERLLASSFHGPAWLTGGPLGPEASLLVFPVIAALFALFLARYRERLFPRPQATTADPPPRPS